MLIASIIAIAVFSVSIISLGDVFVAATDGNGRDQQTEVSRIFNKTNSINSNKSDNNSDVLKVQILANSLEKRIKDAIALMEITGKSSEIRSMPNASLLNATLNGFNGIPEHADMTRRTVAQNIISNYNDISAIGFIMPNGVVYFLEPYSRQENLTTDNLAFRDYYKGVLNTNKTYLEIVDSASSDHRQTNIAVPVFSNDNTLIGLWVGGIDLSVFDQELQSIKLPEGQRIVYVDSNGGEIAGSDNKLVTNISESFANLTSFQRAIGGGSGSVIEEVDQEKMLISYYPVEALNDRWAILWMRPVNDSSNIIKSPR
ncbi:MAG: cache domain-containing protein [Nitrososphaeraceae archaeon]